MVDFVADTGAVAPTSRRGMRLPGAPGLVYKVSLILRFRRQPYFLYHTPLPFYQGVSSSHFMQASKDRVDKVVILSRDLISEISNSVRVPTPDGIHDRLSDLDRHRPRLTFDVFGMQVIMHPCLFTTTIASRPSYRVRPADCGMILLGLRTVSKIAEGFTLAPSRFLTKPIAPSKPCFVYPVMTPATARLEAPQL